MHVWNLFNYSTKAHRHTHTQTSVNYYYKLDSITRLMRVKNNTIIIN